LNNAQGRYQVLACNSLVISGSRLLPLSGQTHFG
jgi:hypothetical protein